VRRTDVQVENLGEGEARSAMATAQLTAGASARADGDLDVDDLNHMLRDELSAMETYRQALDRNRGEYGQDARFGQLEQMMRDHEQACSQLRAMIRQLGGSESQDSGAWGTWANTVMGTARLFGDTAALKALKEGEESGIKDYEDMLQDHAPSPEMQRVLASIVEQERRHVQQLDRLMESA
jgi:rubrerythrin